MFRSGPSAALAAAANQSPSSGPDPVGSSHGSTGLIGVAGQVTQSANAAASWLDTHWQGWVVGGLKIAFVVVLALVVRSLVHGMIRRLIGRMNRNSPDQPAHGSPRLGGLLVNVERRRQRAEAIGSVLRSIASFLILGTAALTVLSTLGIDLAPVLASAGVVGVAIGLGAKSLVTDFLSGVFMILEDQYGVGDQIDCGAASGTVLEVGLRVTKLRGANGEILYVRNGEISKVANMSQGWATATLMVQVAAGEDLDRVIGLIETAAEEMSSTSPWDERLWEPVTVLGVDEVTPETVTLKVQAKAMPGQDGPITRELRRRVKAAFDAAGVDVGGGRFANAPVFRLIPSGRDATGATGAEGAENLQRTRG